MLEIIDYNKIKRYKKYLPFDNYYNSVLYYDKDLIHKILFSETPDLNIILNMVDKLKLDELIEIKNLIYENGNMVGYTVKNYKQYKSLNKFKNRKFELKRQDCIKLVKSFDNILKNNLSYVDFHLGNVLLNPKNNDIKICDLDGLILNTGKESEEIGLKKLLILIFTYLYNINQHHIRNVFIGNDHTENTFIDICLSDKNLSINYLLNIIENIKYKDVIKEKRLII